MSEIRWKGIWCPPVIGGVFERLEIVNEFADGGSAGAAGSVRGRNRWCLLRESRSAPVLRAGHCTVRVQLSSRITLILGTARLHRPS